jgi:hypothetical protein
MPTFNPRPNRRSSVLIAALAAGTLVIGASPTPVAAATMCNTELPHQPSNDNRASAKDLSGGTFTTNGRNCYATKEVGEPNHAGQAAAKSVWFDLDTFQGYAARIDVYTAGSDFDTRLAVYTTEGGTLVAENDDVATGNDTSKVSFLRAPTGPSRVIEYKVAVDGYTRGATTAEGTYIISWVQPLVAFTSTTHLTRSIFRVYNGTDPSSADYSKTIAEYKSGHDRQPGMIADNRGRPGIDAAMPVARLYTSVFNRLPDPSGLAYWIKKRKAGATLNDIAAAMTASNEFKTTYGTLDNGQFVDLVYQNVLKRAPDSSGRTYWINKLNSGFKRSAMMAQFSESNEYVTKSEKVTRAAIIWRLGHGSKTDAQIRTMASTYFYGTDYFTFLLEDPQFKSYIAGF